MKRERTMRLQNLEIGKAYRIKTVGWETPSGEMIPGEFMTRKILESVSETNTKFHDGPAPADVVASWKRLMRVENLSDGRVHLLDPSIIESATKVTPETLNTRNHDL